MGKGLAITGLVISVITLILAWYVRVILFTFNDSLETGLIYLTIILGICGLIINLLVLIKTNWKAVLPWIGLILLILAGLVPQIFKLEM